MASFIAAGTSLSTSNVPMIPFYIYYSMFGFQRVGDLAWAAGDMRTRGFLLGGTSGRTTLNGEGLQHEDGHSHVLSATIPNCVSYDPTFAYEVAVLIEHGLKRMLTPIRKTYFSNPTLVNESYEHPPNCRPGVEDGIVPAACISSAKHPKPRAAIKVQLLGSRRDPERSPSPPAELLANDSGMCRPKSGVSPVSRNLPREARDVERWNMLHPTETPPRALRYGTAFRIWRGPRYRVDRLHEALRRTDPFVRARPLPRLGKDGFGRSDYRLKLRASFFEVDRHFVTVAALKTLADEKQNSVRQGRRSDPQIRHRPRKAKSRAQLIRAAHQGRLPPCPSSTSRCRISATSKMFLLSKFSSVRAIRSKPTTRSSRSRATRRQWKFLRRFREEYRRS